MRLFVRVSRRVNLSSYTRFGHTFGPDWSELPDADTSLYAELSEDQSLEVRLDQQDIPADIKLAPVVRDLVGGGYYVDGEAVGLVSAMRNEVTGGFGISADGADITGLLREPSVRMAAFGDSISNQCSSVGSVNFNGYAGWAVMLSGGAVTFDHSLNFGVVGQTTAQILARVPDVIAVKPGICVVLAGVNDVAAGNINYSTTTANLAAIYGALTRAGIVVIAVPILPSATFSQALKQSCGRINSWISNYIRSIPLLYLANPIQNYVDYSATGANLGDPIGGATAAGTAYTYDGLHPNTRGAWAIGKAIADTLVRIVGQRKTQFLNPSDVWSATTNPFGNLISNGAMVGTSGAVSGTATGSVATSWSVQGSGTCACSKGTRTLDNGATAETQIITLGASSSALIYQDLYNAAGSPVGANLATEWDVGASSAVNMYEFYAKTSDASAALTAFFGGSGANNYFPTVIPSGVMRVPTFTVIDASLVRCQMRIATAAGGSATIVVNGAGLRPEFVF